tara:strand:- start:4227 stop:5087 length:861 start_codon:yes stop_codon:yes gene_type:complete
MKTVFFTYASKKYLKSARKLLRTAKKYNIFDELKIFSRKELESTKFYIENKIILDEPEGGGCFLWKIFYLHQEYSKLIEGDIIFYADAGSYFIKNPKPLINLCLEKEILLFNINNSPLNKHWTKRDTFVIMDMDSKSFYEKEQYNAAFQLYKKTPENDIFLDELLHYGKLFDAISYRKNKLEKTNLKGFVEHRSDQSILSLLAANYNIEYHRDPSQWGNYKKPLHLRKKNEWTSLNYVKNPIDNSPYETLIYHHRNKKKISELKERVWWINKINGYKNLIKSVISK